MGVKLEPTKASKVEVTIEDAFKSFIDEKECTTSQPQ